MNESKKGLRLEQKGSEIKFVDFQVCPSCGKADGYVSIGRGRWGYAAHIRPNGWPVMISPRLRIRQPKNRAASTTSLGLANSRTSTAKNWNDKSDLQRLIA